MSEVIIFEPKHKLDCQKNYDEFIDFAKNKLTIFDDYEFKGKKGWECEKWRWQGGHKKHSIIFGVAESGYKWRSYKAPFRDFARAFVRYKLSIKIHKSRGFSEVLPILYSALEKQAVSKGFVDKVDIMDISNSVVNTASEMIVKSNYAQATKKRHCDSLSQIVSFIREMKFKLDLQQYKNPISRVQTSEIKLDAENRKIQKEKCPTDFQMMQVAEAFYRAKTPKQKYVSSLCVMLICQPSRRCELLGLTTNSLQTSDKNRKYLMWHPAKGGDPVRKWVPKILEDIVQEAFNRLVEISKPARMAAKFAYDNPDEFMIHDLCINSNKYSQDVPLTYDEFANAIGWQTGIANRGVRVSWASKNEKWIKKLINDLNGVKDWRKELLKGNTILADNSIAKKGTLDVIGTKIIFPSYSDLRKYVDDTYIQKGFPKLNDSDIYLWDSILLVRENEFHPDFGVKQFSWMPYGLGSFNDAIGANRAYKKGYTILLKSIFHELDLHDEDGSLLKLTSHQFRHWLNTKLQLGGVDEWLIAKWSGRADINQNKVYDGRTAAQKQKLTKLIGHVEGKSSSTAVTVAQVSKELSVYSSDNPPPPILLHKLGLGVSLRSLGVPRDGVAQFTGLGFCPHNYAESPCTKNGDCMSCHEHVCMKGLPNTLEELQSLEQLTAEQLENAKQASGEQVFGADRWVTSLGFRLARLQTIIRFMTDPNNPDGAMIKIPSELDPSPVKQSLEKDNGDVNPEIIPVIDLMSLTKKNLGID